MEAGWKNDKHVTQWRNTLATYAYPELGKRPVQTIDTGHVLKVLEPIWATKPETASRVRQRIEAVLDWASARGYRSGDNPARWRGHLDHLLPAQRKVATVKHHAALPYSEVAAFISRPSRAAGHDRAGAGVPDPHRRADRRSHRRAQGRDRLEGEALDRPGRVA